MLPLVAVYCPAGHGLHDWLPGLELYVLVGHTGIPPRPPNSTPPRIQVSVQSGAAPAAAASGTGARGRGALAVGAVVADIAGARAGPGRGGAASEARRARRRSAQAVQVGATGCRRCNGWAPAGQMNGEHHWQEARAGLRQACEELYLGTMTTRSVIGGCQRCRLEREERAVKSKPRSSLAAPADSAWRGDVARTRARGRQRCADRGAELAGGAVCGQPQWRRPQPARVRDRRGARPVLHQSARTRARGGTWLRLVGAGRAVYGGGAGPRITPGAFVSGDTLAPIAVWAYRCRRPRTSRRWSC